MSNRFAWRPAGTAAAVTVSLMLAACSRPSEAPPPSSPARNPGAPTSTPPSTTPAATPPAAPAAPIPGAPSSVPIDITPAASGPAPAASVASVTHGGAAGIAWRAAATDADVDAAFAQARAESKPVFMYWGAKWCPPCNQVKATLFNRHDFIERSRAFVPVYVDGDSPGAQKIGARFHVSGYPTMVLFNPRGAELTRLPGEVDAARYTEVLTLGMNAQRPVREVLAQALSSAPKVGTKSAAAPALTANDWRLLSFYSWDTDEQQLVAKGGTAVLLARLAAACPAGLADVRTRLQLEALARAGDPQAPRADPAAPALLMKVLADAAATRSHLDVLTNSAADLTRAASAPETAPRQALLAAFDAAMKRLEDDPTLSRADRITALGARVDLARLDVPNDAASDRAAAPRPLLPPALLADVRAHTARDDREITDGYERQAVITQDAYVLEEAGLGAESDALLKANLAKSHSPYYLMSALGSNAKKRGDKAGALQWYAQAFDRSQGPATRLQWGAAYLNALVELAPNDAARIEKAAHQVLAEAGTQSDAFYERSGRSLQRVGAKLQAWNRDGTHAAVVGRLRTQLDGVCRGLPSGDPQRASCEAVFKPLEKMTL